MPAAGAESGSVVAALRDRLLAAFPGEIHSLYLLGSRALGRETPASDFDLAILFGQPADAARRQAVERWAETIRRGDGLMVDTTVLDPADLAGGVRPYLKIGRCLIGEDMLSGAPLRPADELVAYYGHLAAYFLWAVRGRPAALEHPLSYPAADQEFRGYDRHGIRVGDNRYEPGCAQLVNDACSLANYRMARLAGAFCPSKSLTVATCGRCLPGDPWLPLVRELYDLGRTQGHGRLPGPPADRRRLADACGALLAFENEELTACLLALPRFAALPDADLRERTRGILRIVTSRDPAVAAALAAAQALL
jgi:hypothetical protein